MAEESCSIRSKGDGTIYLLSRQLGEEQFRHLREILEDCLGPVSEIQIVGDDDSAGPQTKLVDEKHEELRHRG